MQSSEKLTKDLVGEVDHILRQAQCRSLSVSYTYDPDIKEVEGQFTSARVFFGDEFKSCTIHLSPSLETKQEVAKSARVGVGISCLMLKNHIMHAIGKNAKPDGTFEDFDALLFMNPLGKDENQYVVNNLYADANVEKAVKLLLICARTPILELNFVYEGPDKSGKHIKVAETLKSKVERSRSGFPYMSWDKTPISVEEPLKTYAIGSIARFLVKHPKIKLSHERARNLKDYLGYTLRVNDTPIKTANKLVDVVDW